MFKKKVKEEDLEEKHEDEYKVLHKKTIKETNKKEGPYNRGKWDRWQAGRGCSDPRHHSLPSSQSHLRAWPGLAPNPWLAMG